MGQELGNSVILPALPYEENPDSNLPFPIILTIELSK